MPSSSTADGRYGFPFGPSVSAWYSERGGLVSRVESTEMIADRWDIPCEEMDACGSRSQQRMIAAIREGRLDGELIAVSGGDGAAITVDGGYERRRWTTERTWLPHFGQSTVE